MVHDVCSLMRAPSRQEQARRNLDLEFSFREGRGRGETGERESAAGFDARCWESMLNQCCTSAEVVGRVYRMKRVLLYRGAIE